jgi:hypothetical protein
LKDQGYDSDSTIVFHKKADSEIESLNPVEQKLAYRRYVKPKNIILNFTIEFCFLHFRMQAGGEPPLQGFRKTVVNETNRGKFKIHYQYISTTRIVNQVRKMFCLEIC